MPIARFQLPDGKVARFEVPEGTTPEVAQELIAKQFPNLAGPSEPSMANQIGRQIGLTGRYLVEGATTYPNMVGDAVGLESTRTVSDWLTKFGLPVPEGAKERVVADVARSMAGQGALMKTAATAPAGAVRDLLTSNAGSQVVSAGAASGAAGATREAGGGTVAQLLAGLTGGVAAPVAATVAYEGGKALGRGVKSAIKPFTAGGREEIVAETLRRASTDPDRAIANMASADELVAGSKPTTAQAARDPGLLTTERALRSGQAGGQFSERASQQNQARNILLNDLAKDEAAIEAARGARESATAPLREEALERVRAVGVTTEKLIRQLRAQESQPGIRSSDVQAGAINEIKEKIAKFADQDGFIHGEDLYTIRKEIGSTIRKFSEANQSWDKKRTAQLTDHIQAWIDDAIEVAGGKGWKDYLSTYSQKSKPIEQLETLQDLRGKVLNPGTDAVTGERIMSPAKFYQAVTRNEGELSKVLTPDQMKNLKSIGADLERGALSDSAGRAAGSNTYQNLSTAYILGQSLGGRTADSPLMQNLMRPVAWLNKLNEPELQKLMTDAMLDPALARSLMGRASPRAVESVALELRNRAVALGLGGATGTGTAVSAPSATPERRQGK